MGERGCSSGLASICFNQHVPIRIAYLLILELPGSIPMMISIENVPKNNCFMHNRRYSEVVFGLPHKREDLVG